MSRRFAALKPQLNRIRAWAHEGSTDAWIAHQLETTAEAVRAFRQEHGIERGGPAPLAPITPDSVVEAMLAEEAAALEAAPSRASRDASAPEAPAGRGAARLRPGAAARRQRAAEATAEEAPAGRGAVAEEARAAERGARPKHAAAAAARAAAPARSRARRERPSDRRGRRRGEPAAEADARPPRPRATTSRPAAARPASAAAPSRSRPRCAHAASRRACCPAACCCSTPSVTADPTFQEHWGDAGALRVEISADAIVLRRSAADAEPDRRPRL